MPDWDVVVVGAGAAGLLAATRAAERGRKTLLIEKNKRPGVKILISGGTRCNLTHACDARGIVEAFGQQGRFLHSALAALSPGDLVDLIEAEGVLTKTEPTGKIFPVSDKATDVLAALLRRLERSGCVLATQEAVQSVDAIDGKFRITTERSLLTAESLAITTGGCSYPGSGTTGDGYAWTANLGHTIVPARPALVPVTTNVDWVRGLAGITIPDVGVTVQPRNQVGSSETTTGGMIKQGDASLADRTSWQLVATERPLASRRGSFLFTHFGMSGPAALDVSRAITGHPQPSALDLVCDFLPALSDAAFDQTLQDNARSAGKRLLSSILPDHLPRRLTAALLKLADIPEELRCAEFGKAARARAVRAFKHCRIPVSGTLGFKKAEVTAGGISLAEVDSRNMESRVVPRLYLAGEVLDLDGPIGGFNFQAAFSTGWLAGMNL
jgi:predicted flavoprotein YhiN